MFDSPSLRGVQLTNDESMYPDTLRGFSSNIHGMADSNAEVSFRQKGNEIYRTHEASGAFVISDLHPLSSSWDLKVVVTAAEGSVQSVIVSYSSVPVLQREGKIRYALTTVR